MSVYNDYDIGLRAYYPDGEQIGFLHQPLSLQVAYPFNDLPSLMFSYPKDSPEAKWFIANGSSGWEVAVNIWVPGKNAWIEPPNSRFLVLQWEDDVTDGTNVISFTCPGYAWLLSKQLVRKGKRDDALNKVEADAKKAFDEATQKLRQAEGTMNGTVSGVRSAMKFKGGAYYGSVFPKRVKIGKQMLPPRYKSVFYHGRVDKFYWYGSKGWTLMASAKATSQIPTAKTHYNTYASRKATYESTKKTYERAKYNAREATKDGKRPMLQTTAGWAMARHYDETKSYGYRIPAMRKSFNGTYGSGTNSAGKLYRKWTRRFNIDLTIGMSLLDLLKELTGMGMCDWQMRGRTLDVYRPGDFATDVSDRIALHLGLDLTDAPDRATRHEFANYLLVRGDGNLSFGMKHTGAHASTGWGAWEKAVSASGAKTVKGASALALREAKDSLKRIKTESTRGLIVRQGGPRPMYDYLPGHYVRAYGTSGAMERVRVMQITLTRENGGYVGGNLVLADRFYAQAINFNESLAKTVGGYETTIGGGTVPMLPAPPPEVPESARAAPPSVAASALTAINPTTGAATTKLMIAWAPAGEDSIEPLPLEEEPDDTTDPDELTPEY